jgi:hypothetical protein
MGFQIDEINKLIPPDLSEQKKGRLREGLRQFSESKNSQDQYYTDFYLPSSLNYFLQGDLIRELRFPIFNTVTGQYEKQYFDALLISNTCDVDESNKNTVTKKVVLAKLIPVNLYVASLKELAVENAADILTQIKNQQFSNILYLPPNKEQNEYLAYFDDLSTIEKEELNPLKEEIILNRIESLDYFGYYLFIFKLSYHFCRLPEETER